LEDFRNADRANAHSKEETGAEFKDNISGASYIYYFDAPNFTMTAYKAGTGGRRTLANYNHALGAKSIDVEGLKAALKLTASFKAVQGGPLQMTEELSTVVALTSEAARSKVVEELFLRVIAGARAVLKDYEVLFKCYKHTAIFRGYLNKQDSDEKDLKQKGPKKKGPSQELGYYTDVWQPLEKQDYIAYFNSPSYTGDRARDIASVENL
jgi:hypothetical protein